MSVINKVWLISINLKTGAIKLSYEPVFKLDHLDNEYWKGIVATADRKIAEKIFKIMKG